MSGGAFFPYNSETYIAAIAQGHHVFIDRCSGERWCLNLIEAQQLYDDLYRLLKDKRYG